MKPRLRTKIISLIVMSLLFFFVALAPSANAETQQTSSLSKPENYIEYLNNYSLDDAYDSGVTDINLAKQAVLQAKVTKDQFEKLPKEKQKKYLEIISNPQKLAHIFRGEIEKLGEDAKYVSFEKSKTETSTPISTFASSRTITQEGTLSAFGISWTKYRIEGKYEYNSGGATRALRTYAVVAYHYNPAITTDKTSETGYVSNGHYYGDAVFNFKLGVGIGIIQVGNVYIGIEGNEIGKYYGYFYSRMG